MLFQPIDFMWLAKRQQAVERGEAEETDEDIFDVVREVWANLSIAYEKQDPFGSLLACDEFPGYLRTSCGQWTVFVPWPLVKSFPRETVVRELLDIGRNFAIAPLSCLCLSGSSAMVGSEIEIGDIDYCQYINLAPAAIVADAESFTQPADGRILTKASYGSLVAERPWVQTWTTLAEEMEKAKTIASARRFMIDFLGRVPSFGVLPVSNVVLASEFHDRAEGAASQSFVYQEAVAVAAPNPAPPWSLVDPSQIGKYINFLCDQIDKYAENNPLKAIKRALSLAHTIQMHEFIREALDILLSPKSVAYIRWRRKQELHRQLALCTVAERDCILGQVDTSFMKDDEDGVSDPAGNDGTGRCLAVLSQLRAELDNLEKRVKSEAREAHRDGRG